MVPSFTPTYQSDVGPLFYPLSDAGSSRGATAPEMSLLNPDPNASATLTLRELVPCLRELQLTFSPVGTTTKDGLDKKTADGDTAAAVSIEAASLLTKVRLGKDEWARYCSPSHFSEYHVTR